MREIRLSGSEGGVADNGHLYPYPRSSPEIGQPVAIPLAPDLNRLPDRGRDGRCRPPLPPNRTSGFPASGSPVGESPAGGGTGAFDSGQGV